MAVAVLGVLFAVAALAGFGGETSELDTAVEDLGAPEVERHAPRPSGDDAQRPAPVDSSWVEIAPDLVADGSDPTDRPSQPPVATVIPEIEHPREGTTAPLGTGSPFVSPAPSPADGSAGDPAPVAPPRPVEAGPSDPLQGLGESGDIGEAPTSPIAIGHHLSMTPLDQIRCPELDLVAIGDLPEDADDDLEAFGPRFRDLAAAELEREELVCAGPIHRWRDLVIQRLYARAEPDGTLAASADGAGDVIRFTFPEWKGYRLTGEDDFPFNLGGRPTGRETLADHSIVRTTNGALVSRRADTHGFLVINGAWTLWADQDGRSWMGHPETQPALSGSLGIYQDFAHGWLQIPGVVNPFEAERLGPEAYVWHPVLDPQADVPSDARGNILEVNETSWFIDQQGLRHWIPDKREFDCVRSEHGSRKITVRGWVVATFPLGEAYTCPDT